MRNADDDMTAAGGVMRRRLGQFRRSEEGGATIFTLFLIMVMMIFTGYAIDTIRFESNRARLQSTLDRAVLSAASLSQALPCEEVVEDYFDKSMMENITEDIDCDVSASGRTALVEAELKLPTLFMDRFFFQDNPDTLVAPASSAATQSTTDIEISLVLDVTGSMFGHRILNLKAASQAFTDKVLGADTAKRISIAIVPFHSNVHLDPWLLNQLPGVFAKLGYTGNACIDLPPSVWSTAGIDPATPMPQQPVMWAGAQQIPNPISMNWGNCQMKPMNDYLQISLPSQDIAGIKAELGALSAYGATSIYLGMKWGLSMIDPLFRPIYDKAIMENRMPATLAGRPFDYGREDTMKVIVLMTDGEHIQSYYVNEGYHAGPSGIYRGEDGNIAIHHPTWPGPNKFYVHHLAPGNGVGDTLPGWMSTAAWDGSGNVTELDWVDVWKTLSSQWVIDNLYARPLSNNDPVESTKIKQTQALAIRPLTVPAVMDEQLLSTCSQAKERGVVVFAIAYLAPPHAETLLQNCASSLDKYYAPTLGEIGNTFDSIANTISALRLTQ